MSEETVARVTPSRVSELEGATVTRPSSHLSSISLSESLANQSVGFELLSEIGRGGMGVVYRARDRSLDREVAVKLLQEQYAPTSGTAARFVDEARITGQLQHPGIPAVYQVGVWNDGRPFLAMKLIKGRNLDDCLKTDGPHPTRWLVQFEAICHAVGYAHARGVIHRDLKPQNVMVGAFGEVQVMDWGLAKVLAAPERERPAPVVEQPAVSEIRSLRESDGSVTQAGSVLGTPAFMPPEQAAGELDKIDCRSDVFGLGAILCVLLTGHPPYSGRDAQEMRVKAVRGDTQEAFARLDKSGAETDIIALCKQCLTFASSDRPSDANAIASRLAELFAATTERTQQAERERHTLEVRATEQARRRRAMMWSAAAVIAVLSAGVVASLLQAKRARDAESATTAQLAKTQEAEAAARAKSEELDATLRLISFANVREGQEAKAVEFYQRLLAIRLSTAGETPSLESQVDIANAYSDLGNAHWRLSQLREVRTSFGKELEVRKSIAAARPETNEYEERLATTYGNLANVLWELEEKDAAIEHRKRNVEVYERLLKAKPNERWCLSGRAHARLRLGEWLRLAGKFKESREVLTAALSDWLLLRKQDPAQVADYVAATHKEIGLVARESGDLKGEQEAYQLALDDIEHMEQFADKRAEYYEMFASVSLELKDSASAVRGYREAVEIRQLLLQVNPKDADARAALVKAFSHLGGAAYLARDYKLAVDCYEKSLETAKSLDRLKDRSIDVEFLQILLTNSRAQLDRVAPPPRMKPEK